MTAKVPTFSECVIGYREWVIDPFGELRAITMTEQVWAPGENVATCVAGQRVFVGQSSAPRGHGAPHADCECGLYAWNDLDTLCAVPRLRATNWLGAPDVLRVEVAGAVAAWGDLQVHHEGFRAERACVAALAYTAENSARERELFAQVAARYGVPLVHVDLLQAEAEQHGTPLPAQVRPPKSSMGELVFTIPPVASFMSSLFGATQAFQTFGSAIAQRRTYVLALNRDIARAWAKQEGLGDWRYIGDPMSLRGHVLEPRDIVFVGDVERRKDWPELAAALLPTLHGSDGTLNDVRRVDPPEPPKGLNARSPHLHAQRRPFGRGQV